jgi:hypothetical protein
LGAGGMASMIGGVAYLAAKGSVVSSANQVIKLPLKQAFDTASKKFADSTKNYNTLLDLSERGYDVQDTITVSKEYMTECRTELETATQRLDNFSGFKMNGGQIAFGSVLILAGAIMVGVSIWQLTKLYNQYEVTYTDIPDNMVDVVSYQDGDRFVNYKNVPAYYYNDKGVLTTRENDLNAYDGRQWVSLYYTKNYEAGYCLTSSPDLIATEAEKTGYTSVHLFGRSDGYNTNAYCNRNNAEAVYLAFKYSTNQKSAVTDIPDIVGSVFNIGTIAISATTGFAIGAFLMALINKKKLKAATASV